MFSSFLAKPTVTVTVEQDTIFVRPPPRGSGLVSEDPEARGTVLLSLPGPRAVKSIRVVLEGICDAYGGNGWKYENSTTLHKFLDLELDGEVLTAGNHAFNFSFIIPSSTAVYQRSTYGRVRHYVKANVQFSTGMMSSLASYPVGIFISAHQNPANEPPEPLEVAIEHFSEDIGPIGIGLSSPHFTVASLLSLRVALLGAPTDITIHSITCSVIQAFSIDYEDGKKSTPAPQRCVLPPVPPTPAPAERLPFGKKDANGARDLTPLVALQAGEEFRLARIMRVPDDDLVRPTTLEGTETRIRVSHKLSVEIHYRKAGASEDTAIKIQKPIIIASCCSVIDSLFLPAYVKTAPKTIIRPINLRCLCNLSLKEMVDRDGFALQHAGTISTAEDSRTLGVDRIDKSPGYQEGFGWGMDQ